MGGITVEHWVDSCQSRGKYTFLREEVLDRTNLSPEATKKALQRLVRKKRVLKLKDYFYLIVPLEYVAAGSPPASWFIHDLMSAMSLPYYVAVLSAAAQYGAAHQQPQEFQVVTDRSVRPIFAGRAKVRFFASKFVETAATRSIKTPTGNMQVSAPETTAVDLVRFARAAGHLSNVATVLSQLVPDLDPKKLLAATRLVSDVPNTKRLGYLLDNVGGESLSQPIHDWLKKQSPRPVPLQPGRGVSDAFEDRRWHVLVNQSIEVDT